MISLSAHRPHTMHYDDAFAFSVSGSDPPGANNQHRPSSSFRTHSSHITHDTSSYVYDDATPRPQTASTSQRPTTRNREYGNHRTSLTFQRGFSLGLGEASTFAFDAPSQSYTRVADPVYEMQTPVEELEHPHYDHDDIHNQTPSAHDSGFNGYFEEPAIPRIPSANHDIVFHGQYPSDQRVQMLYAEPHDYEFSDSDSYDDHDMDSGGGGEDGTEVICEGLYSMIRKMTIHDDDTRDEDVPCAGQDQAQAQARAEARYSSYVAVKSSTTRREFSQEPHDIVKEIRLLRCLSHPNIIPFLTSWHDDIHTTLSYTMPYLPYSLEDLLEDPWFAPNPPPEDILHSTISPVPHPLIAFLSHIRTTANGETNTNHPPDHRNPPSTPSIFEELTTSIAYQLFSALAYLHHSDRAIAHRDIKPANMLLEYQPGPASSHGAGGVRLRLIDFGIAYREGGCASLQPTAEVREEPDPLVGLEDLWPERKERMYFEVSTGPYRPPELLFGSRSYDAQAVDLWSAGCVLAECFRPLRARIRTTLHDTLEMDDESDDDEEDLNDLASGEGGMKPFIVRGHRPSLDIPKQGDSSRGWASNGSDGTQALSCEWTRIPLFDSTRGEIGLAWSIFKVKGTPDAESWPGFVDLPDASTLAFNVVPKIDLHRLLPNLPSQFNHTGSGLSGMLGLIESLLDYPPEKRMRAEEVLRSGLSWLGVHG